MRDAPVPRPWVVKRLRVLQCLVGAESPGPSGGCRGERLYCTRFRVAVGRALCGFRPLALVLGSGRCAPRSVWALSLCCRGLVCSWLAASFFLSVPVFPVCSVFCVYVRYLFVLCWGFLWALLLYPTPRARPAMFTSFFFCLLPGFRVFVVYSIFLVFCTDARRTSHDVDR